MTNYIVIENSNSNFTIAKPQVGSQHKYLALATCRSRHQAERIVEALNIRRESLELVEEFHTAFKIRTPEKPELPNKEKMDDYLRMCLGIVNNAGLHFHEFAEAAKANEGDNTLVLRLQLMMEELIEVIKAMIEGNLTNVLQELADLRYVVDGTVLALGLKEYYMLGIKEVHRANMSKLDENGQPIFNEAGRVVKSSLFKPADIGKILDMEA